MNVASCVLDYRIKSYKGRVWEWIEGMGENSVRINWMWQQKFRDLSSEYSHATCDAFIRMLYADVWWFLHRTEWKRTRENDIISIFYVILHFFCFSFRYVLCSFSHAYAHIFYFILSFSMRNRLLELGNNEFLCCGWNGDDCVEMLKIFHVFCKLVSNFSKTYVQVIALWQFIQLWRNVCCYTKHSSFDSIYANAIQHCSCFLCG